MRLEEENASRFLWKQRCYDFYEKKCSHNHPTSFHWRNDWRI